MNARELWSRARPWLAMLLLLALSVGGFWGLMDQWAADHSPGAVFSNAAQTAYAVLGLVAAFGLFRKARWTRTALSVWAVALIITGASAAMIWGEQGWGAAAGAAGLMVVCAAVVFWLAWPASAKR